MEDNNETTKEMLVEWEVSDRPRSHFIYLTSLLKRPYCAECGEDKYKTKKERKAYEANKRQELKAYGYTLTKRDKKRIGEQPNDRRWASW